MTRVAFNPIKPLHVDVGGVVRVFRHTVAPYDDDFKDVGGGASINARYNVTAGTKLLMQSAFGSGFGRYIGGLVPDAAFRRDGSISTIGTTSWVGGVEQKISPRLSLGGYYSGVDTDANFDLDTDGSYIGFGFPGSSNSNNRRIQEITGDRVLSVCAIAGPRFGAVQPAGLVAQERPLVARKRTGVGQGLSVLCPGSLQPAVSRSNLRAVTGYVLEVHRKARSSQRALRPGSTRPMILSGIEAATASGMGSRTPDYAVLAGDAAARSGRAPMSSMRRTRSTVRFSWPMRRFEIVPGRLTPYALDRQQNQVRRSTLIADAVTVRQPLRIMRWRAVA